ncbi:MAG: nucleotidyltransferase family protein [Gammaproteobacteria bacterium]
MRNTRSKPTFTALVLAGDRGTDDPLVAKAGVACKALVEINGKPMVLHVLDTLQSADPVSRCILSGPERSQLKGQHRIENQISNNQLDWIKPEKTPSTSAYVAMQSIPEDQPILLTTADHPLLTADIVNSFCSLSLKKEADVTVALCRYELIKSTFPGMKKTVLKFSDGEYCGCNLFSFLTPNSRELANKWRQVEDDRKNPLRVIKLLGWFSVLRYMTGTLSLNDAMRRLSRKLGLRISIIDMPFAEAAVDVDSISDQKIVQAHLASSKLSGGKENTKVVE